MVFNTKQRLAGLTQHALPAFPISLIGQQGIDNFLLALAAMHLIIDQPESPCVFIKIGVY
jgi:hypothetical protein